MAKRSVDISADGRSVRAAIKAARDAYRLICDHLVQVFSYVGEACVTEARTNGAYRDITGNLRSSVGYIVMEGGKAVVDGRKEIVKEGREGAEQAERLLRRLGKEFPQGIVLIVCAGMNYASYVENIHGKNVLASANIRAEELVPKLLGQLVRQANNDKR